MSAPRRTPLTDGEKDDLKKLVSKLRSALELELGRILEGTYGIHRSGEPEDESRLELGPEQLRSRTELLGLWRALGRRTDLLVREAAFTHVNRLIAIRVAEALELLPESLAQGRRSSGFRGLLEVAPLLGSDDDAGYWTYLQLCGDELAHDIPRLFDPRNPLLALRPSPGRVDELVALVNGHSFGAGSDQESPWAAPDTLGWTYQYFNSNEERSAMRKAHPQPQDSRELAVRNQFFTPAYVVRFLVHNTAGRRLVEGGFTDLAPELDLLVDPPNKPGEPIELEDFRVLDPACGSGHFLLGAYEVLERAWQLSGVDPGDAAPKILESLWGIDIDPRAAQVAAAALNFRARRHHPDGFLPTPHVVCARSLPLGEGGKAALLASVSASHRVFLTEVLNLLDAAPELGSLLKIEDVLQGETAQNLAYGGGRTRAPKPQPTSLLDAALESGAIETDTLIEGLMGNIQEAADQVTSTPEERVLAADGGDAMRLVTALTQRYDAVLMNPPFGEPIPETKAYLKAAYPWLPTRDYNLLAVFVGRGIDLCKPTGYLGAITSRAGMFLTTFQRWRKEVLLGNNLLVLADLGHKVMTDALVEAAAYVVRPGTARHEQPATFIRLLREPPLSRPGALEEVCQRLRFGEPDQRAFRVSAADFDAVPGSPMAYWLSPDIRRLFTEYPPLEGHGADVRQGLATGDDFRFVRAFWEVNPARIARTREETFEGKRWVPFAKGGEYSPFWSDIHLVVDFERNGERLRESQDSRPQNLQYFFRPGLTWPRRTQAGFNPSILPSGCAIADKGPGIFVIDTPSTLGLLGSLCARPTLLALNLMTTFGSYEVGAVGKLPNWSRAAGAQLAQAAGKIVAYKRELDKSYETTRLFTAPTGLGGYQGAVQQESSQLWKAIDLLEEWDSADRSSTALLSFDERARASLDDEVGTIPVRAVNKDSGPRAPRYIDDVLEEEAARAGISVREIVQTAPPGWIDNRPRLQAVWTDLFSYLIGCAFGRWDVRIGRDPDSAPLLSDDPFAPVPVCPPGMLVGSDALPARQTPPGYPLALSEHRLLMDEPGHPDDLIDRVEAAAGALVDDPRRLIGELTEGLGVPDLRTYLRKRFFKEHLSRYSKSRRKAPIYWPLSIPSGNWTIWLYAPTLSRETIYAVASHAERRHNAAETEIRRLESAQLQASTPNTPGFDAATARSLALRLDEERRLAEELRGMRKTLHRVANSGWTPDSDDGIVVNAAPFTHVLPDWPDPSDLLKKLKAGELSWTTAHRWRDKL